MTEYDSGARASRDLIVIENLVREYQVGGQTIRALDGVTLTIQHGEFVAIMGPSGSGKSTMMNMIGCLDTPTAGRYCLDGFDVAHLSEDDLAMLRNQKIGFVFQSFNLLPRTTALENVELPMMYLGVPSKIRKQRALEALQRVGLAERVYNRPNELSGGQQQRVAIARALVNNPVLILADEPTGALDSRTTEDILNLFEELHAQGNTIVLVTHEDEVGRHAKRIVRFRDGRVELDTGAQRKVGVPKHVD
ncbi:putative ABC transport system ATP-binding protein [Alicyclobacillus hesperidum]|uniref:Putative ABC transport system ATP-binding protein n=1 Tax=Alicyclobacillus hesperidum TaxID=89784 RepID=A0A1H2XBW9_9BACL|nr:ABC transporter ATP-binding protein [Alicyclobacillus hesperidum]SDW90301.1 putative ABC transport system ATP-binding protein [Alicyclobacillus hesperidum]